MPTTKICESGGSSRPSLEQIYMRFAEHLARRSTCKRLQVGAVIVTNDLEQVLALGYNGNARGLINTCDSEEVGNCGCIHAELNALIKCGKQHPDKIMFVTSSPCVACAKAIINSRFSKVYFSREFRKRDGIYLLEQCGITVGIVQNESDSAR